PDAEEDDAANVREDEERPLRRCLCQQRGRSTLLREEGQRRRPRIDLGRGVCAGEHDGQHMEDAHALAQITGDDEDRAAFHAEAQDPVPSAPATEPTEPETPAEETGDESTEEGGQGEKSGATADLGVEDGHVQYLRAIQNFSPALERWVLDEEAGEVTYGIVNCAGQTKSEGVATLERVDGGDGAAFE